MLMNLSTILGCFMKDDCYLHVSNVAEVLKDERLIWGPPLSIDIQSHLFYSFYPTCKQHPSVTLQFLPFRVKRKLCLLLNTSHASGC